MGSSPAGTDPRGPGRSSKVAASRPTHTIYPRSTNLQTFRTGKIRRLVLNSALTLRAANPLARAPPRVPPAEGVPRNARLPLVEHPLALTPQRLLRPQVTSEGSAADVRPKALAAVSGPAGYALKRVQGNKHGGALVEYFILLRS